MQIRSLKGIFFYFLIGSPSIVLLIFLIISFTNPDFADLRDFLSIFFPIYTSIVISLISSTFLHFFHAPSLSLDLEPSRHFLINEFEIEVARQTSGVQIREGESPIARAKYIRINLRNKGKETAKNCRIKLHIYFPDHELVREPSNLYPSGFHQYKKDRIPPPFIDIAAGDSQIFDICSTTNITVERNLIRFEDYFNYSRVEVKNNPILFDGIKFFFIKLFVYSDNSEPFERQYKILKNLKIDAGEWRQIDIQEDKWEKQKKEVKFISEKPDSDKTAETMEKDEVISQKVDYQSQSYSKEPYNDKKEYDEHLKGDYTTGL